MSQQEMLNHLLSFRVSSVGSVEVLEVKKLSEVSVVLSPQEEWVM